MVAAIGFRKTYVVIGENARVKRTRRRTGAKKSKQRTRARAGWSTPIDSLASFVGHVGRRGRRNRGRRNHRMASAAGALRGKRSRPRCGSTFEDCCPRGVPILRLPDDAYSGESVRFTARAGGGGSHLQPLRGRSCMGLTSLHATARPSQLRSARSRVPVSSWTLGSEFGSSGCNSMAFARK